MQVHGICDVVAIFSNPRIRGVGLERQTEELVHLHLDLAVRTHEFNMVVSDVKLHALLDVLIGMKTLRPVHGRGSNEYVWQYRPLTIRHDPRDERVLISPEGCQFTVCRGSSPLRLDGPLDLKIARQRNVAGYNQIELSIGRPGSVIALRLLGTGLLTALVQVGSIKLVRQNNGVCTVRIPSVLTIHPPRCRIIR